MKPMQQWLDDYGKSHQNPTNKLIHWFCVPLIFFSLLGLLASIPLNFTSSLIPQYLLPFLHFGTLLIFIGLIFYIRLSISMAIGIFSFSLLCLQGIVWINSTEQSLWLVSLIIFAGAWVGQFIGHKIEGAKPSFLEDLKYLMIGPAWLLAFIYEKLGIRY